MRRVLALACRAFPRDHRARHSDEVIDTAVLAAGGSVRGTAREAASLAVAGAWQRLRAEPSFSLRDGVALLARVLAVVNLAVAMGGIVNAAGSPTVYGNGGLGPRVLGFHPFVVDWWWIAFTAMAAGIVLGLVLGNRRLAAGAAIASLGLVAYDALFLVNGTEWDTGHLSVFGYGQPSAFPVGGDWLVAAIILALATAAAAPSRRLPLRNLALVLVATVPLVVLSREIPGSFFFLLWPLGAVVVLAVAFGGVAPRLAVLAAGGVLAALPSLVGYLSETPGRHSPLVTWAGAAGLALGLLLPLAQLTRRRLT